MSRPFSGSLLIGRFQPFHNEHLALLERALALGDRVLVVLGSASHAPNAKNPFTDSEREAMILGALPPEERSRVAFHRQPDLFEDQPWADSIRSAARGAFGDRPACLVGFEKDDSSYYLRLFPEMEFVACPFRSDLSSTAIRDAAYSGAPFPFSESMPASSLAALESFLRSERFGVLRREREELSRSRPGISIAADAVAVRSGRVLLIRRGGAVGYGLWALPGGFVEEREPWARAALRELAEETCLDLLSGSVPFRLLRQEAFDHPARSLRGRVITQAFLFDLGEGDLPAVEGADDAMRARWVDFSELASLRERLHDDHWLILERMLSGFPGAPFP